MPLTGFGNSKPVRLRYHEVVTIDAPVSGVQILNFAANGLFDPNISGIGHGPAGFTQWSARYSHYTVIGSKIRVRPIANAAADSVTTPSYVGVITTADPSQLSGLAPEKIIENRLGQHIVAGNFRNQGDRGHGACRAYFSARKFFGNRNPIAEQGYKGTPSTNPSELAHFLIWAGYIVATDNPSQLFVEVDIEYSAVFTEPNTIPN